MSGCGPTVADGVLRARRTEREQRSRESGGSPAVVVCASGVTGEGVRRRKPVVRPFLRRSRTLRSCRSFTLVPRRMHARAAVTHLFDYLRAALSTESDPMSCSAVRCWTAVRWVRRFLRNLAQVRGMAKQQRHGGQPSTRGSRAEISQPKSLIQLNLHSFRPLHRTVVCFLGQTSSRRAEPWIGHAKWHMRSASNTTRSRCSS